jgi:hypothetical protein
MVLEFMLVALSLAIDVELSPMPALPETTIETRTCGGALPPPCVDSSAAEPDCYPIDDSGKGH